MQALNQMLDIVSGIFFNLLGNVIFYAFIGGIIGIVLAVFFLKYARRQQWMERSNGFWSFLAKTSFFLMPMALFLTGVVQGGIWGAHCTASDLIDEATRPVIEYASVYIPQVQNFVDNYVLPAGSSERDIVAAYNDVVNQNESGFLMQQFNTVLLGAFLESMPSASSDFVDPIQKLGEINLLSLKPTDLEIIPSSMKAFTSFYLAPVYWACFLPFLIYTLAVFIEAMFYHKLLRGQAATVNSYSNIQFA